MSTSMKLGTCIDCKETKASLWVRGVTCRKCYRRTYYRENATEAKEQARAWVQANRERWEGTKKEWRKNNRKRENASYRAWRLVNIERVRELERKSRDTDHRRAYSAHKRTERQRTVAGQTPEWADKNATLHFYKSCPDGMTIDHIVPLKNPNVCGLHWVANFQYLPQSLNSSKSNKFDTNAYAEWLRNPQVTIFMGDKVVPLGGTVSASPADVGTQIESTDVIGENTCLKK